jgi:hypothetical protein
MESICPDCDGRGYVTSDPDGREMVCQTCIETWTFDDAEAHRERVAWERTRREAEIEDQIDAIMERLRSK